MSFTQTMLEGNRSGQTKHDSDDQNSADPHKEVQQCITTVSSNNGDLKKSSGNKVIIETTISWSKLPPLSPSHPDVEVISDGTTSTDAGSESSDDKENEKPENPTYLPRCDVKSKLKRLGAMHSGDPEIGIIRRTEDRFTSEESSSNLMACRNKDAGRSARLAALANTINHWEDDPRHFTGGKEAQGFSRTVSNQRLIYTYNEKEKSTPPENVASAVKPLSPVKQPSPEKIPSPLKPLLQTARLPSKSSPIRATSPLKPRYGSPVQMGVAVLKGKNNKVPSNSDEEPSAPVMGMKLLRDRTRSQSMLTNDCGGKRDKESRATSPTKQPRDPAELPLAERMALFERNTGQAVLPKTPFTMPVPCSKLQNKLSCTEQKSKICKSSELLSSGSLHERLALFERGSQENQNVKRMQPSERQQELDMLRQSWTKNKGVTVPVKEDYKFSVPPPPPPMPSPPEPFEYGRAWKSACGYYSEEDYSAPVQQQTGLKKNQYYQSEYPDLKEVKKVTFSPVKPRCPYSNLSDVDSEGRETEQENSDNNRSLTSTSSQESDVSSCEQDYVKSNLKRDWSDSENYGAEVNEIDDFLEEALDISSGDTSPPKRSLYSCNMQDEEASFHLGYSPSRREQHESSSLLHTVSFYRKQQNMAMKSITPVRQVEMNLSYLEESFDQTDDENYKELVKQKIDQLQLEVEKQQTYISQASQALDLCYSTFEFSGSTELLEAEKLLLLASQRRQVLLQEMQRLKLEGSLYPGVPSLSERGSLTISHITLPLRMDVIHDAAKDDECYYLLCLVCHNEEILSSDIMSSRRSLHSGNKITFPNKFMVRNLNNDFKITIELYAMKARHKELIPHDIKYHININKKEVNKLRLTPRKAKGESKLVAQSPAGASASTARIPAFTLAGYIVFSLREMHRKQFTLSKSKTTYNNVVEGSLQLSLESEMQVDVEYRGFLTMFEEISGLGAWHRRWCLLKGDKLSYWRYPDDEQKKIPLGTIELSQCTNKEVEVVRRDICARPNTLQLFTVRRARHTESLVLTRREGKTCVRHWLSADTREERDQWCHHLNKALVLMRAWGVSTAL